MNEPTRRLFFALWPDERVRRGIIERGEMIGPVSRKRVPDHNLHMTLLFLGDQPERRLAEFEAAAGMVAGACCELRLNRFGWFPGARVVWLGGEAPETLRRFQAELGRQIGRLGIALDARPFKPHVTLFRKVERRPDLPEPPPLGWPVSDFALVESIPGRPYQVLRSWPLESEPTR